MISKQVADKQSAVKVKMPNWYYDKKALRKTPSFLDGIKNEKEQRYRREGARFIINVGTKMGLRNDTMATGVVYFHRFYMFHSFTVFPRFITACCCLFLAGKVEETPKKCKDIIKTARSHLTEKQFQMFGDDPKEEVMTLERILLKTIKFDLQVQHPYQFLIRYAKSFKGDKEKLHKMVQMAWTFINDSLCTTLCLQWEPEIVAIAVIYLAGKLSKFEIHDWANRLPGQRRWWDAYVEDISVELLEDICHQILDLYSAPIPDTPQDSPPDSPVTPKASKRPASAVSSAANSPKVAKLDLAYQAGIAIPTINSAGTSGHMMQTLMQTGRPTTPVMTVGAPIQVVPSQTVANASRVVIPANMIDGAMPRSVTAAAQVPSAHPQVVSVTHAQLATAHAQVSGVQPLHAQMAAAAAHAAAAHAQMTAAQHAAAAHAAQSAAVSQDGRAGERVVSGQLPLPPPPPLSLSGHQHYATQQQLQQGSASANLQQSQQLTAAMQGTQPPLPHSMAPSTSNYPPPPPPIQQQAASAPTSSITNHHPSQIQQSHHHAPPPPPPPQQQQEQQQQQPPQQQQSQHNSQATAASAAAAATYYAANTNSAAHYQAQQAYYHHTGGLLATPPPTTPQSTAKAPTTPGVLRHPPPPPPPPPPQEYHAAYGQGYGGSEYEYGGYSEQHSSMRTPQRTRPPRFHPMQRPPSGYTHRMPPPHTMGMGPPPMRGPVRH